MIINNILGYSIDSRFEIPVNKVSLKTIINTINPHCYCEAKKDIIYRQALMCSDILLPDGIGIVWAIYILTGEKIRRIAGADIHLKLLQALNDSRGRVFYMGSSTHTLQKIHQKIKIEFPNIVVESYSPPYKPIFTTEENSQILSAINKFQPDVLFIGMTAPKQEKWVYQHKDQINAKIIASVGAVFDFYAGTIKRPNKFWRDLGLEWLIRFLHEPKRLYRRNFISTPCFLLDVLRSKLKRKETRA
jgi:N-acetylglucosaminyldiphosphoundecaprenol N-acetyl-beta-D-mannosaminyltransferase